MDQRVPNPLLCKALLDRITDRAHIIETGTESFPECSGKPEGEFSRHEQIFQSDIVLQTGDRTALGPAPIPSPG